jgi:tetratricopeptide (TPR) repeat protein
MAIEGALAEVSLADICQLLSMGRKTGCLEMSEGSNLGYIYFDDGRVTFSSVINRPDRLGDLLVKNGVITEADLNGAMEAQKSSAGKRLGEVLIERGSLSQEQLDRYVQVQIEEAVYHLFGWNEGSFKFVADIKPDEDVLLVSVPIDALLMEGARRVDEWSLVEKKISSMDLIFALERDPLAEDGVELSDSQRRIIPLIDGERTVQDLVEASGLVEFDTGKALYGLIQAGFANQVGRRATEDADGKSVEERLKLGLAFYRSGMFEDSTRELKKALTGNPRHAVARQHLALISLRSGRPREALVHFDEMEGEGGGSYADLRNRALALERMGRFQESLDMLDSAEKLKAKDPSLSMARAICHLKNGDALDALKSFQVYRDQLEDDEVPPAVFFAYSVLAAGMAGDLDRAIMIGREGVGHYPNEGAILVNTGGVVAHKGEAAAAEAFFKRAIEEGGNPPQAHKALGDLALKADDKAAAKSYYEAAVKLDPRLGEDVYIKLGAMALEASNQQDAISYWRRALDINPENMELQARLDQLGAASGA